MDKEKLSKQAETKPDGYTLLCTALFKKLLIERLKGNKPKELRDIRVEAKKLFNEMGLGNGSSETTYSDKAKILVNLPTIEFEISLEDIC